MGLATSQVRLLALTSRKADVEMQIQLNSKRKTMLTRESTELAKLYYAKLQNSKIQYATTNGNKDVTYDYLMAQDTGTFFNQVVSPTSNSGIDTKTSSNMILTDSYGRVILSHSMLDIVLKTLADEGQNSTVGARTVETRTIDAMKHLLSNMSSQGSMPAADIEKAFTSLYEGQAFKTNLNDVNEKPSASACKEGEDVLKFLYENGIKDGGSIWKKDGVYYSNYKCADADKVTPEKGTFYIARNVNDNSFVSGDNDAQGAMYWNTGGKEFVPGLNKTVASQMVSMFKYYGAIFAAAFNGFKSDVNGKTVNNFNVAAKIEEETIKDADGKATKSYKVIDNNTYTTVSNSENLQAGLKSGLYQLVNVSSLKYGGYSKGQNLDYFKTQNYVVEQTDQSTRETITAWYNAAKADLNEKENYWDSEITQLSTELNTITTEIDSVKKLREDAISSTFKWGSA